MFGGPIFKPVKTCMNDTSCVKKNNLTMEFANTQCGQYNGYFKFENVSADPLGNLMDIDIHIANMSEENFTSLQKNNVTTDMDYDALLQLYLEGFTRTVYYDKDTLTIVNTNE